MVPRAVSTITFLFGIGSPRLGEQRPELGGDRDGEGARRAHTHRGGGPLRRLPDNDLTGSVRLEGQEVHGARRSLAPRAPRRPASPGSALPTRAARARAGF